MYCKGNCAEEEPNLVPLNSSGLYPGLQLSYCLRNYPPACSDLQVSERLRYLHSPTLSFMFTYRKASKRKTEGLTVAILLT